MEALERKQSNLQSEFEDLDKFEEPSDKIEEFEKNEDFGYPKLTNDFDKNEIEDLDQYGSSALESNLNNFGNNMDSNFGTAIDANMFGTVMEEEKIDFNKIDLDREKRPSLQAKKLVVHDNFDFEELKPTAVVPKIRENYMNNLDVEEMIKPSNIKESQIVEGYAAPKLAERQNSEDSNYEDSTIDDLKQNDFSISVTEAKKMTPAADPKAQSSYFSYLAPAVSTTYVTYQIETQSRLPGYISPNKMHIVIRRFSDFEYLLNKLMGKEEYKSLCFPPLPEKRMYGNLEDSFIEKRRLELEGFLRVLVKKDKSIKSDPDVYAFLT